MRPLCFRFELRLPDGDDAGTFETALPNWHVGDTFRGGDDYGVYPITAIILRERIEEFVARALYGVWEVEPL